MLDLQRSAFSMRMPTQSRWQGHAVKLSLELVEARIIPRAVGGPMERVSAKDGQRKGKGQRKGQERRRKEHE